MVINLLDQIIGDMFAKQWMKWDFSPARLTLKSGSALKHVMMVLNITNMSFSTLTISLILWKNPKTLYDVNWNQDLL